MKVFWTLSRDRIIEQEINGVVSRLTSGDYTDEEISKIVLTIKNRSLGYLKERRESLSKDLENNIESIKKLES